MYIIPIINSQNENSHIENVLIIIIQLTDKTVYYLI